MPLNFTDYNYTLYVSERINVLDVLRDVCVQMDAQILRVMMLVATFIVFNKVLLPRGKEGINEMTGYKFESFVNSYTKHIFDFVENLGVMAMAYIIIVYFVAGVGTGFKVWAIILLIILVLPMIVEKMGKLRKK